MFGFFNKKTDTSKEIKTICTKADKALGLAYQNKNTNLLCDFFTRGCIVRLLPIINNSRKDNLVSSKFTNVIWDVLDDSNPDDTKVRKIVKFDKLNLSGGLQVAVDDDYEETWVLRESLVDELIKEDC